MPTVHCPSCKRALNLPESADIESAQCPLCRTAFEVPARAAPALPPVPRANVREIGSPASSPSPFEFDEDHQALTPAGDRRAVHSACTWMRAAGVVGLAHLFFCACVSFALIGPREYLVVAYCGSYLFQFFASLIVYRGATALQDRTSSAAVYLAGVLALVMSALTVLLASPVFFATAEAIALPGGSPAGEDVMF